MSLFGAKNSGFFEIYGVSAQARWEGCDGTRGRGSIFRDFVRSLLWTAPYVKHLRTAIIGMN